MGMGNGRGAPQQVDGFTALRSAVLSVANGKSKPETMARLNRSYDLINALEQYTQAQVAQCARFASILTSVTKGVIVGTMFTVPRPVTDGLLEFFDSVGTPVPLVDPFTRMLLVLPSHILPIRAKITDKDGTLQEVEARCFDIQTRQELTPGVQPAPSALDPAAPPAELGDVEAELAAADHWNDETPAEPEPPAEPSIILGPDGSPAR